MTMIRNMLLSACLLLPACAAGPGGDDAAVKNAIAVARGIGDAVLRVRGATELKRLAPDLMLLIDAPGADGSPADGVLTLAEVEAFLGGTAADPQSTATLLAMLILLRSGS